MELAIRKATLKDIDFCVATRVEVLKAANLLAEDTDMSAVEQATREYYENNMDSGCHIEFLAFAKDAFVGCGAACVYRVMPTCNNPSGKKAYIMNMYTRAAYRRCGAASQILKRLVLSLQAMGIQDIQLEATNMGLPLYEKAGFKPLQCEMKLEALLLE